MPKKAKALEKIADSKLSTEGNIEKSPSSNNSSPPSKLSNITKFFQSPTGDDKRKKTKTKKSTRKANDKSNLSTNGSKKNAKGKTATTITRRQEQSPEHSDEKLAVTATSVTGEKEHGDVPCTSAYVQDRDTCTSPTTDANRNLPSNSSNTKGGDSGKKTMVQTNLSMGKDGIEVISSPEQQTRKKKKTKSSSKKKGESSKKQTKISNIFPLRKSNRRTKVQQEKDELARITKAILSQTFEGLEVRTTEGKGRGVFTTRAFKRSEFVCEYTGELISYNVAKKREKQYEEDTNIGCYMYYLSCNNKKYCVDATAEDGTLGRLLNHSRSGNCKTKVHVIEEKPHLIFVTTRDVKIGEELTYDYGERNKEAVASHPWLKH